MIAFTYFTNPALILVQNATPMYGKRIITRHRYRVPAGESLGLPEANLPDGATVSHVSPLVTYALLAAALLLALIALVVALLK